MTPDEERWETLVEEFGLARATLIETILGGHPIRRTEIDRRRARETFERLVAEGWPDGTRARSIRRLAARCEIDPRTARRWLSGARSLPCPTVNA